MQYRSLECSKVHCPTSITWPALKKGYSATLLLGVGEKSIFLTEFTVGHLCIWVKRNRMGKKILGRWPKPSAGATGSGPYLLVTLKDKIVHFLLYY